MLRTQLKGKNIGVVFGTFAPLHIGHLSLIHQAKKEQDGVIVVVSGYEGDRGHQVSLPLSKRFNKVRIAFEGDSLVEVRYLDESSMARYPDGWEPWLLKLDEILQQASKEQANYTFYLGESDYLEQINQRRPHYKVKLADRSHIPISGTQIRQSPLPNFESIAAPFRGTFSQNYLVVGAASTGKTTLLTDLARILSAPLSLEYAREYQQKWNKRDEELDYLAYVDLLTGQFNQMASLIDSSQNKGIVLSDTNSTVTMAYIDYFIKDLITDEQYQSLYQIYLEVSKRERWHEIFMILPESEFIDDGYRDMGMAATGVRETFTQHLYQYFVKEQKEHLITWVKADDTKQSTDDTTVFYRNYQFILNKIYKNRDEAFKL